MKKILILTAILLTACSTPEQRQEEPTNCNCWTILQSTSYTLPNQTPTSVVIIKNDCSGLQKQVNRSGTYVVGDKLCD